MVARGNASPGAVHEQRFASAVNTESVQPSPLCVENGTRRQVCVLLKQEPRQSPADRLFCSPQVKALLKKLFFFFFPFE